MSKQNETVKFWTPLEEGDPRLPIQVIGTEGVIVPEASKKYLKHVVDRVVFPNGNEGYHHRLLYPGGVMVAHVNEDGLAMVDNYRHPLRRWSRELPSGNVDPGEDLVHAAIREMHEETGYKLKPDQVDRLFPGPLQGSLSMSHQTYHIFLGQGGEQQESSIDGEEEGTLTSHRIPLADAVEQVGVEIVDPATSASIGRLAMIYDIRPSSLSRLELPHR